MVEATINLQWTTTVTCQAYDTHCCLLFNHAYHGLYPCITNITINRYCWSDMCLRPAVIDDAQATVPTCLWLAIYDQCAQLVSWSLTSPFSTNMAISETKGWGWRAIPTQWRKASDILTSTLAAFLLSSHQKKERDREAHLNYYTSAYNRERQLSHRKTKLNQIQQYTTLNLN